MNTASSHANRHPRALPKTILQKQKEDAVLARLRKEIEAEKLIEDIHREQRERSTRQWWDRLHWWERIFR